MSNPTNRRVSYANRDLDVQPSNSQIEPKERKRDKSNSRVSRASRFSKNLDRSRVSILTATSTFFTFSKVQEASQTGKTLKSRTNPNF